MPMRPCSKCLTNHWSFEKKETWMEATCRNCKNVVSWDIGKKVHFEPKEGYLCKCGQGKLSIQTSPFRPKKLKKSYYFTHYLKCGACFKSFYLDEYKILNDGVCARNIADSIELGKMTKNVKVKNVMQLFDVQKVAQLNKEQRRRTKTVWKS